MYTVNFIHIITLLHFHLQTEISISEVASILIYNSKQYIYKIDNAIIKDLQKKAYLE